MSISQDRQGLNTENVSLSLPQFKTYTQNAYNPKPQPTTINTSNIPDPLKALDIWVCWKYELNDKQDKWTKVPYQADCKARAQSTNYKTWCSYADALKSYQSGLCDGIGIFNSYLAKVNPKTGETLREGHTIAIENFIQGDIDHCFKPDGTLTDLAQNILNLLGPAYVEVSPSGTGIRFLCSADIDLKYKKNSELGLELYQHGRYVTITGNVLDNSVSEILDKTSEVQTIYKKYLHKEEKQQPKQSANIAALDLSDFDLLQKMFESSNGAEIKSIYEGYFPEGQRSEYDLKLCNHLAFWTQKNAARIDALFRQSGLMRPKWDEHRGHDTYGNITIDKAILNCSDVYDPNYGSSPIKEDKAKTPKYKIDDVSTLADEVITVNQRYLDPELFEKYATDGNIVIVESPLGTGKSTALERYTKKRTHFIGATHLQALTKSLAEKFNTAHYSYVSAKDYQNINSINSELTQNYHRLITCWNSLPKLKNTALDTGKMYIPKLFFVDEIDACVHRLSDTDVLNAQGIFDTARALINQTPEVILMSAYIDKAVIDLVREAAPHKKIIYIKNTYQAAQNTTYTELKGSVSVHKKVLSYLQAGESVAVPTNSDTFAKTLYESVKKHHPNKKVLLVDAATKAEKMQDDFIENPNIECKKYDCIIYTPTINAGLSVDAGHGFKAVSYLCAMSTLPKDSMQLISRFRELDNVELAIDRRCETVSTNPKEILESLYETLRLENDLLEITLDGSLVFRNKSFEAVHAATILNKNLQKQDMYGAMIALLNATGRKDSSVEIEEPTEADKELFKGARAHADDIHADEIVNAKDIEESEARELELNTNLKQSQHLSILKNGYKAFYGTSFSSMDKEAQKALILEDKRGTTRRQVEKLLQYHFGDGYVLWKRQSIADRVKADLTSSSLPIVKLKALAVENEFTGIVLALANIHLEDTPEGVELVQSKPYTADEVRGQLYDMYEALKVFKGVCDLPSKKELLKNPLKWLGHQLKKLGIETERKKTSARKQISFKDKNGYLKEKSIPVYEYAANFKNNKALNMRKVIISDSLYKTKTPKCEPIKNTVSDANTETFQDKNIVFSGGGVHA